MARRVAPLEEKEIWEQLLYGEQGATGPFPAV